MTPLPGSQSAAHHQMYAFQLPTVIESLISLAAERASVIPGCALALAVGVR